MDLNPIPIGNDVQVNTYTGNEQNWSSVAALAGGGFVVTWTSSGQDGSDVGIYGQRYAADGTRLGSEFRVNTFIASEQKWSSVAALAGGGFVVTWTSSGQDGSYQGIYGQQYAADGTRLGSEFRVNSYTMGTQRDSSVAALAGGGFVVTWSSHDEGGDFGIYGQRYLADGTALGTEFRVNTHTRYDQHLSSMAGLAGGGFVVTWSSHLQDGELSGIYGQRYAANGTALGAEFRVNTFTTESQYYSSVAALAGGGFVVTWSSWQPGDDRVGIYGQRYAADGTALGTEFHVNTYTTSDQSYSSVAALADGGFVVTWSSYGQDGDGWGIYGQRYTANGTALGAEFRVNQITDGDQLAFSHQYYPAGYSMSSATVAALADGRLVQVWGGTGAEEVFFRLINIPAPNEAPTITSNGGGAAASVSVAENTTAVTTVTATDQDIGQTLSYSIIGGADAGKFTIGATTGALSFITAPNFELPTDAGGNNVYDVIVQASDGYGGIDTQAIAVGVQNVMGASILGTAGNDVIDITHTANITATLVDAAFGQPSFELAAFAPGAGGWSSDNLYKRELADVNADGMADIVGFGHSGVSVSLATGNGHFAAPTFELAAFAPGAGGWSSDNLYKRELADVNADGMADIVGFGHSGVSVSLATGNGHFAAPTFELAAFAPGAGGWSSDNLYKRELADVNADGMADIVGFGHSGVSVSLATGNGHFAAPTFELAAFAPGAGGWSSDNLYKRELADVNADGRADIVGFGHSGVSVSLATGNGHFAAPTFELAAFAPGAGGWSSDNLYKRELADVNADGMADIVGFSHSGVSVSQATGNGHFAAPTFELGAFGPGAGGWSSDDLYNRELADVNGDGRADIVGFGQAGVFVSQAHDFLLI